MSKSLNNSSRLTTLYAICLGSSILASVLINDSIFRLISNTWNGHNSSLSLRFLCLRLTTTAIIIKYLRPGSSCGERLDPATINRLPYKVCIQFNIYSNT